MKLINKYINSFISIGVIGVLFLAGSGIATAAGTATLSISPSSGSYTKDNTFTITVYENSGSTGINTVEADMAYNSSQLQYVTSTVSSPFGALPTSQNPSPGLVSLVGFVSSTQLYNQQTVGTVTFKVISAGSSSITFVSKSGSLGSAIITQSGASNIWNGSTTGGTFTLTNPPASTGTPVGNTSSTAPTATSKTTASNKTTPSASSTPTAPATTTSTSTNATPTTATSAGYLVAIKILDANNHPAKGVKVTLDTNLTATTDATGIASFINVSQGNHTAKVTLNGKTTSQFIDVKGISSTGVQQFAIQTKTGSSTDKLTLVVAAFFVLALLAFIGYIIWRRFGPGPEMPVGGAPIFNSPVVTPGSAPESSAATANLIDQIPTAPPLPDGAVIAPNAINLSGTQSNGFDLSEKGANNEQTR